MLQVVRNLKIGKNNYIAKTAKIFDNVIIGDNNYIGENVVLYPGVEIGNNNHIFPENIVGELHKNEKYNVVIGNNNKFLKGSIIYPNTIIGNHNVFLNNNILGEHPVVSSENVFSEKRFGGLKIGNSNFFHIKNIICSGFDNPTCIGNNNKFLAECHVSHDCKIQDFVYLYPKVFLGGYVNMHSYSGAGAGSFIHQKKIIGGFAFTSMNSSIVKHSFPFYVNIQNKFTRLNLYRIESFYSPIVSHEKCLQDILQKYNQQKELKIEEYNLPIKIASIISYFISETSK